MGRICRLQKTGLLTKSAAAGLWRSSQLTNVMPDVLPLGVS